jgi:hypothetical protein
MSRGLCCVLVTVGILAKIPTTRDEIKSEIKRCHLEREERKNRNNGPQEGVGGEGLCLYSQECQDLCPCKTAEELIFNTSSEHQTMDLSNRCRPRMIHVRVCAQRSRATKTQGNLVYPGFSKSHTDEDTKVLFRVGDLVVLQKRCLRTHG